MPVFHKTGYDAKSHLSFGSAVDGSTVVENDIIAVVHIAGDPGNLLPVLLRDLHCVKQALLVFTDQVDQVGTDREIFICS